MGFSIRTRRGINMFGKTKIDNIPDTGRLQPPSFLGKDEQERLLHPRLTAEEAYRKSQVGRLAADAKALDGAFEKIEEVANHGETSYVFFEGDTDIALLSKKLPKYGYRAEQKTYGVECALQVSWNKDSQGTSDGSEDESESDKPEIDPDKKYILPMEGTKFPNNLHQLYVTHVEDRWSTVYAGVIDKDAGITVTAKDLEEAPDWVKAIKPIEVEDQEAKFITNDIN